MIVCGALSEPEEQFPDRTGRPRLHPTGVAQPRVATEVFSIPVACAATVPGRDERLTDNRAITSNWPATAGVLFQSGRLQHVDLPHRWHPTLNTSPPEGLVLRPASGCIGQAEY